MKKLVFSIAFMLLSIAVFAQSAYEKVMTEKIKKIETCKTTDDFSAVANDFARIGDKEEKEWLPYYYAGFSAIQKGRILMREKRMSELDDAANYAEKFVNAAESRSDNNAEILILKKMVHSLRLMVDPQARFMTEGAMAAEQIEKAEALDPDNPRITLLKAEDVYFTPAQFGGSKQKGLELFAKALEQFKKKKSENPLNPNWGQAQAEYFLKNKP